MGKFFGIMACLGTLAIVSGCGKVPDQRTRIAKAQSDLKEKLEKQSADNDNMIADVLERTREMAKRSGNATCRKNEEDQKISEVALADTKTIQMTATEQETVYVNCKKVDRPVGPIIDIALSSVVIAGPQTTEAITSVEVESDRTCAKLDSEKLVADVNQAPESILLLLEADGDVRVPLSNSNIEGLTVAEGKNLVKLKYFNCEKETEVTNADGTVTKSCEVKKLVAEKEIVLNVIIDKQVVEGVKRVDLCPSSTTGDQE